MGKRDGIYDGVDYESPYPTPLEQVIKYCDICGIEMVVNNFADQKSRTPRIFNLIVCPECDPRPMSDRYIKQGFRIMHRRKLRVIRLAQVTRAIARVGCLKHAAPDFEPDCKCPGCAARKLFPNV